MTAATLVAAAFLIPRGTLPPLAGRKAPSAWLMAAASFAAGSTFALVKYLGPRLALPVALEVAGMLAVGVALGFFVARSARAEGWSDRHLLGVAAGGLLVYGWLGFVLVRELHGPGFEASQTVFVALALGVLGLAARVSLTTHSSSLPASDASPGTGMTLLGATTAECRLRGPAQGLACQG